MNEEFYTAAVVDDDSTVGTVVDVAGVGSFILDVVFKHRLIAQVP